MAVTEQPAAIAPGASRKWIYASTALLLLILVGLLIVPKLRDSGATATEQTTPAPIKAAPVEEKQTTTPAPVPAAIPTPVVVTPAPTPTPPKEEKRAPVETPSPEPKEVNKSTASVGVVREVLPQIPQRARNSIQGKVALSVKAQVDPQGNVTDVELDSPGPSKYFADLTLKAVRQWKFAPQKVASEWILRFQIRRAETNVVPERVAK